MQLFNILLRFGLAAVMAITASFAVAQESKKDADQDKDDSNAEPELVIGSKAPDLDIEYWLSDNDGLFPQVKKFEADNIYVIDFWSIRSPISILAMYQMGKIQSQYEAKDVQIISVSVDDIDTVEDFLEREAPGGDEEESKTFADLTRSYCLTADPDKSVWNDYFVASGRRQFPSTFIVGKTGLIEWVGRSAELKKPLDKIIAGQWDRDEFKEKYKADQAAAAELRKNALKVQRKLTKLMPPIQEKIEDGDEDGAIDLLAELVEDEELESVKPMLKTMQLRLMLSAEHEDAASSLREFVEENKADGSALNSVTWAIYELFEERGGDVDTEVLKIARKGAEYAAKAEPESGAILDTLAHYIYVVDEDLDKAIEVQRKAVEYAGVQLEDIKPFLDELLKEKETGKKKKKKQKVEDSDF